MRNAPSVMYPVGRCALYGRMLTALGIAAALLLAGWAWYTKTPWLGPVGILGWLLWLGFAARSWWRSPVGYLRWRPPTRDGSSARHGAWLWHDGSATDGVTLQRLEAVLDLQGWILLRYREPSTPWMRWAWVERERDPARWGDLRRALVASHN